MKRIAFVIIAVLSSLSLQAQEDASFVVATGDADVVFQVSEVDSISFNPASTSSAVSVSKLMEALEELESLRSDLDYMWFDISYAQGMINWLSDQRNIMNDSIGSINRRLAAAGSRSDSLHALSSSGIESLRVATKARLDSLSLFVRQFDEREDSIQQIVDNRLMRADSLFARLDSITIQTDSAVSSLRSLAADTLAVRLVQQELLSDSLGTLLTRQQLVADSLGTLLTRQRLSADSLGGLLAQSLTVQQLQQQTIEQLASTVVQLQGELADARRQIARSQDYTDVNSGQSYRMALIDGQLVTIPAYNNILVLGNSFSTHDYVEDLWWSDHSMAASTADVTWLKYLEQVSATQVDVVRGWHFEWYYQNENFNFEVEIPVGKHYDVVIVQIQENAWPNPLYDYEAAWGRLYTYLKSKCPDAVFMQCIGWYQEQRYDGIVRAAEQFGIPVVDNRQAIEQGMFRTGDYVYGSVDHEYHAIDNESVALHPSDVGFLFMANNVLRQLGLPTVEKRMHALNVAESEGGQLSLAYHQWPEKGLVSIRVEPDEGHNLASLTVQTASGATVEAVRRSNNCYQEEEHVYYTFIMPSEDVTITPVWN